MPIGDRIGGFIRPGFNPLLAPGAPTIGTADGESGLGTTVSITFTAPSDVGGGAVTGYTATARNTSSGATSSATGTSSPIAITGLTLGQAYTVTVAAENAYGPGGASAASNSVTTSLIEGQTVYDTYASYSWVAPVGVTSVSVVCVGAGSPTGGGGGGLGYKNTITVVPGTGYTVRPGGAFTSGGDARQDSYFISTSDVKGGGGVQTSPSIGGDYVGTGGGNGGQGTYINGGSYYGGGGGAGGYSGAGGRGGGANGDATAGSGGGGGGAYRVTYAPGGQGNGGGGVGILGSGSNGAAGGSGGSGGANGTTGSGGTGGVGGAYGGGGGTGDSSGGLGGKGAVRIIWPGTTRYFPSTNTADV